MRPAKYNQDEIIALYEKYHSTRKVAGILGCSQPYVYRVLKRKGIKCDGRPTGTGPIPRHSPKEVIDCFKKLGTVREVAKTLGYPPSSVYGIFKRHGFSIEAYRSENIKKPSP